MSDEPRVPQSEEARRAREAREALIAKEAAADEAAASGRETGKPPVPVWYLLFLAVVVLVLFGRNAFGERTGLDSLLALVFALVLALFVGVLVYRMTSKSPSHTGGRSAWRPSLGAAALAAVFPVVATWHLGLAGLRRRPRRVPRLARRALRARLPPEVARGRRRRRPYR